MLLSELRAEAGLTQEQLAERAGLSVYAVSLLERGARTSPRVTTVARLAEALQLSPLAREAFAGAARRRPKGAPPIWPDAWTLATPLVGREREMARSLALMARPDVRLLTLTGAPGAGKTRLALELASELQDGHRDIAVVTLGSLHDPSLVMAAIRQAMGLAEDATRSPLETVAAHCRPRHVLLVLDNFEHLLAAAPELVELMARCSDLRALVTSRAALRVRGEHELPVPPLELPRADQEYGARPDALRKVASARMFLECVEAVTPGFQLDAGNADAVAAICRRLDGLPLALELAAPWLRLLTPVELLQRLDHRFDLLVGGPRDLPERQRTLRAALDWSAELLDEAPRTVLRRLSVFAGSAPLAGVERVCPAGDGLSGLSALVDHGLVQRYVAAGGGTRLAMLESVREYAREQLVARGELEAAADAHLAFYGDVAASADSELRGAAEGTWMERLALEHDNVRAALGWAVERGRTEAGLRLAAGLRLLWGMGGHRREGLRWLERLLDVPGPVDPGLRARALNAVGFLAVQLGSHELAMERQREALDVFRRLGDRRGVADVLRSLGQSLARRGRYAEAVPVYEEAVALLRDLDDPPRLAQALGDLGLVAAHEGDRRRATALHEEALAIQLDLGNEQRAALALLNLGDLARMDGDLELARTRIEEGAAMARRGSSPYVIGLGLVNLADLAQAAGQVPEARQHYREALTTYAQIGELDYVAHCLRGLGHVAWVGGGASRAVRLYGAADGLVPIASHTDTGTVLAYQRTCEALRDDLGAERFAAMHEAGGRLSLDAAVAEALSEA